MLPTIHLMAATVLSLAKGPALLYMQLLIWALHVYIGHA